MAIVNLTKSNFNETIKGGLPALVEFQASWCGYCRRLGPAFQQVAEQYQGKLAVGQVDIDASPELAEQYHIELVPTLLVFRDGLPVGSAVNPGSKAEIEKLIAQNLDI